MADARSSFSRFKDAALEKAVLLLLKPKLQRYGEIRAFGLDTSAKVMTAEIKLRGEPIPVTVSQARYRIEDAGNETYLVFYDVKVSREWAQNILEDHFPESRVKIPDFLRPLID